MISFTHTAEDGSEETFGTITDGEWLKLTVAPTLSHQDWLELVEIVNTAFKETKKNE